MANPFLSGNFAPVPDERDDICAVEGTLPAALHGTLFRNGPNPVVPPAEPYHWFTGDGMVHAITLDGAGARYRNRWVRTPRFAAERDAGRPLFAGFGQPLTEAAATLDTGVANTHVLAHAGHLLALEEAHPPTRLDPASLETLGADDFAGGLSGRFTAHPKTDPATGQLVFFSYSADGPLSPGMSWGTIEPDGTVSRRELFRAPYCSMVHDFAVTASRVVFPVMPLTGDIERAQAGRPPFAWEGSRPAFFGILDRDAGAASLRWLEAPPCFAYHVMNAFDDGADVVMDVVESDAPALFPTADGSPPPPPHSRLSRWRMDAGGGGGGGRGGSGGGTLRRETLDDAPGEFPRIDERFAGRPYRVGFRICPLPDGRDAIVRHDLAEGRRRDYALPEGERPSEAVFVPASPDAAEGEGWLLSVVWRPRTETSTLVVLDATAPERGPVAEVRLPRRIPFGFHGSWLAATANNAAAAA